MIIARSGLVDPLKASTEVGDEEDQPLVAGRPSLGVSQPVGDESRNFGEGRRCHPAATGADVVLPKRAGSFTRMEILRRRVQPGGLDNEPVNLSELGQIDPETRVGYDDAHAIVDDHSRLAYVEIHDDEKAATVTGFVERALAFFASHGITAKRLLRPSQCRGLVTVKR